MLHPDMNEMDDMQSDPLMEALEKKNTTFRAGPLSLDAGCLSCTAKPAHTV